MQRQAVGVVVAVSCAMVAAAGQDTGASSVRGLAARMIAESACGFGGDAVLGIPECVRLRGDDEHDFTPGFNTVLLPPWEVTPLAACFDANNPPSWEIQQMVNAAMQQFQDRYQLNGNSWPGSDNDPITLTWSFVPDGVSIPSGVGEPVANNNLFAQMDAKFGGVANRATWIAQFQSVFDRWAALTGINYTRITVGGNPWDDGAVWGSAGLAGARGDVRIGMKPIDGANGVLAYNSFPTNGDMVLDSAEGWQSTSNTYRFLRNTISHEHGHGLGLNHVCPSNGTKLMEPFLNTGFDGPRHDDMRAVQRRYGDAYESNDNVGEATVLGALVVGGSLAPSNSPAPSIPFGALTSLGIDGDNDYFRFSVANPIVGTVTVTPVGQSYADYAQTSACDNTVVNTTSQSIADLAFEIRDSSGAVVFASANATGVGGTETVTNFLFSPPGNLHVRIFDNNTFSQTQMYTVVLQGLSTPSMTASDNAFSDKVQVTWSSISGATAYTVYRGTTNVRGDATVLANLGAVTLYDDTTAVPGQTYFYWVEVNTGLGGLRPLAGPDAGTRQGTPAPTNDSCSSAIAVLSGSVTAGTLAGASNDATASCGTSSANPDVWYSFTAPACAGALTVSTCGSHDAGGVDSNTDTVVSLWSACGGSELACNDDAALSGCGALDTGLLRDSLLTRNLAPGESVLIRVSRWNNNTGTAFTLRANFEIANDVCANAIVVASGAATAFCNSGATTDGPGEAACLNFGDNQVNGDLWYRYTAPNNGRFTADLCGSGFDTRVSVYPDACPAVAGTVLACNDDACGTGGTRSSVSAVGVMGTSYLIRVGGYLSNRGSGTLTVFCAPDVNFSGTVSVQDIFDFLDLYFSNNARADINGSGTITVQDIFDFLAAYFTGC